MAGRGPQPKDPSQRVRRTKETRVELPVAPAAAVEAPPLPDGHDERTVAWFDVWRSAPTAARFVSTDWQRLHMLAYVVDAFFAGDVKLLTEIRLNETLLDATVGDRARSKVDLKPPADADAGKPKAEVRRLKVV